jgi:hypothetical protein
MGLTSYTGSRSLEESNSSFDLIEYFILGRSIKFKNIISSKKKNKPLVDGMYSMKIED